MSEKCWRELFWAARKQIKTCRAEQKIDRYIIIMQTIAVFGMAAYVWLIHLGFIAV